MSKLVSVLVVLGIVCTLLLLSLNHDREVEDWTYDRLFKSADAVVLAKCISSADAGNVVREEPPDRFLVGVITRFQVTYAIKGELKKDEKFALFHYRMKEGSRIANGPQLASFHASRMSIQHAGGAVVLAAPEYLLFLIRRKDGRFECVSGQEDAELSVRQVIDPLPPPRPSDK
jgi:hypothetical protein